ncbi:DUF7344 domain-containing protein [Halomicrococcus gelatinilyticus]|uniref:DUF7344 domain-containing protein n=1 Tax=Halomicrococcus gelatinilyticus TaxID=1702103 RepID=UPI002E0F2219
MSATETRTDSATDQVPEPSTEPELSQDDVFHLLQTPRRRYVLRYLKEHEGPAEMREIAEQVAAWENDTTVAALTSDERQRVYIPLYQSHLPKLDEEGVVEYDQSRGIVERTELANRFDRYLEVSEEPDEEDDDRAHQWETYYLGISVLGALLLSGVTAGLPGVSALPPIAVGGLVVTAVTLVTLVQMRVAREERTSQ